MNVIHNIATYAITKDVDSDVHNTNSLHISPCHCHLLFYSWSL